MLPIKTKVRPSGFPPVAKTFPQALRRVARSFLGLKK
jgi:hypothetical protein